MRIGKRISLIVCLFLMFGVIGAESCYGASVPGRVKTLKTSGVTVTNVTLSWSRAKSAKGYAVYCKTGKGGYKKATVTKSRKYTYKKLIPGQKTYFAVKAYNRKKFGKASKAVSVTSSVPAVKLSGKGEVKGVSLSWRGAKGVTGYKVYRDGKLLKTLTETSYTDETGIAGKSCSYFVYAYKTISKKQYISKKSNTVKAAKINRLPEPSVSAESCTVSGKTAVFVSWGANTYADGFKVFRSEASGDFERIGYYKNPYFMDKDVESGKTYTYRVYAYINNDKDTETGRYGESTVTVVSGSEKEDVTNEKAETPFIPVPEKVKPQETSYETVTLSWEENPDCDCYRIYDSKGTLIAETKESSYKLESLSAGTEYAYRITSVRDKEESTGVTVAFKTKEMTVSGLKVSVLGTNSATIKWDAVSAADGYRIYNKKGTLVATVTEAVYRITGLDSCTSYTYSVSAYKGETENSRASVTFKTKLAKPELTTDISSPYKSDYFYTDEMSVKAARPKGAKSVVAIERKYWSGRKWMLEIIDDARQGDYNYKLSDENRKITFYACTLDGDEVAKKIGAPYYSVGGIGTDDDCYSILKKYLSEGTEITVPRKLDTVKNIKIEPKAYSADMTWDEVKGADYYVVTIYKNGSYTDIKVTEPKACVDNLVRNHKYEIQIHAYTDGGSFSRIDKSLIEYSNVEYKAIYLNTRKSPCDDESFADTRTDVRLSYSGDGSSDKTEFYLGEPWTDGLYNSLKKHSSGNGYYLRKNWTEPYAEAPAEECLDTDMYLFDTGDYDNFLAVFVVQNRITGWYTIADTVTNVGDLQVKRGEIIRNSDYKYKYTFGEDIISVLSTSNYYWDDYYRWNEKCGDTDYYPDVKAKEDGIYSIVIGGSGCIKGPETDTYVEDYGNEKEESEIGLHLINALRAYYGVQKLEINPYITGDGETYGAKAWAKTLAANNVFNWTEKELVWDTGFVMKISNGPLKTKKGESYSDSKRFQDIYNAAKTEENLICGRELCGTADRGEELVSDFTNGTVHLLAKRFNRYDKNYIYKWGTETEETTQSSLDDTVISQIGFGFATGYKDGKRTTLAVTYLGSVSGDRFASFVDGERNFNGYEMPN